MLAFFYIRGATLRPDLSCLWKLLGDACTVPHPLPAPLFPSLLRVPETLVPSQPEAGLDKASILRLGARCYLRAAEVLARAGVADEGVSAGLWHNLAFNYLVQAMEIKDDEQKKVGSEV